MQELETGHRGVPTTSSISLWQAVRIGSCGLPVWLWDPGIQWGGGITHFSASRVGRTGDLIHSQADPWGITEALTIWRGILLLRIGANHGVLGTGIVELLWQVGPSLDHHIYYDQELRERRLW